MIQSRGPLDDAQIRHFRDRLLEDRGKIRDILARLTSETIGEEPERTQLEDLGSETFEEAQDLGLAEQAGEEINEIDRALERMDRGTYGICESCDRAIPIDRLEAIPSAPRCADCQSKVERGLEES